MLMKKGNRKACCQLCVFVFNVEGKEMQEAHEAEVTVVKSLTVITVTLKDGGYGSVLLFALVITHPG